MKLANILGQDETKQHIILGQADKKFWNYKFRNDVLLHHLQDA
jgi:hypothetical protein